MVELASCYNVMIMNVWRTSAETACKNRTMRFLQLCAHAHIGVSVFIQFAYAHTYVCKSVYICMCTECLGLYAHACRMRTGSRAVRSATNSCDYDDRAVYVIYSNPAQVRATAISAPECWQMCVLYTIYILNNIDAGSPIHTCVYICDTHLLIRVRVCVAARCA